MTAHTTDPTKDQAQKQTDNGLVNAVAVAPNAPVVLRYRVGFTAMAFIMALSPVWCAWSLFAMFSLLAEAARQLTTGVSGVEIFILPIFFYFLLIALGCLSVVVCSDTRLVIDKQSVRLPWQFLLDCKFCLSRSWSTLKTVRFASAENKSSEEGHPQTMTLHFDDGAHVTFALKGLSRHNLRDLIMAAQAYAPQATFEPPLSSLKLSLMNDRPGQTLHGSFTQLWEAELDNRFGSTIFVPLEPGQIVSGRKPALQILGQLSFGGLSAVYLVGEGQNSSSENKVFILKEAVMPVSTEETLRVKAQEMFERESRLLSSLRHSRIARVYDSFVADGRHYILLEHIEGADLRRFVREHGPQPAAVALRWLVEAAEILRYLHNHEPAIVHRDVTPDNLVLARDGHLSLIDFGAANTMLGTATGTLVGKQSYIAPEQFRGKAQCASDIYSLAGTIYFALTATDPEPLSLLSPASIRSDIAEDFDRLIRHCTAQDVEQRIATADELLARARAIVL